MHYPGKVSAARLRKGSKAYQTKEEKELFLEWTLLGTTVLHEDEWLEVFKETGYTGDYFFTSAKSLHLVRGY